jgi:putative RNA 2'-phosphotransferase
MSKEITRISKFLSLVLRHQPEKIGLELDGKGWASIASLIEKSDNFLTNELLQRAVSENEKKRFVISDNGQFIRANQGHSIKVDLGLKAIEPPAQLFHGTATRFVDAIMFEGLKKMSRQYVHLSLNKVTATKVGQRHGKVAILNVAAGDMYANGFEFFLSKNQVWLTDRVPIEYLSEE